MCDSIHESLGTSSRYHGFPGLWTLMKREKHPLSFTVGKKGLNMGVKASQVNMWKQSFPSGAVKIHQMHSIRQSTGMWLSVYPSCFRNMTEEYLGLCDFAANFYFKINLKENHVIDSMRLQFKKGCVSIWYVDQSWDWFFIANADRQTQSNGP